jgi:hypothetical protein
MFYVKLFKSAIKQFNVSVCVSGRYVIVMSVSSGAPSDDDLPDRQPVDHPTGGPAGRLFLVAVKHPQVARNP